jgi:hypothetical protein
MSQHDFNIANQTSAASRADINSALTALATLSSGATAPSTTYANMLWYDTANNVLKIRNEADSNWINVGYLDQGSNAFRILDDTQVMNTGGTQTGLLGDQATATWEAGTGTTESLISPAKVKAAIEALDPASPGIGDSETWQSFGTFNVNTAYQNTYGKPIQLAVTARTGSSFSGNSSSVATFQTSSNNTTYFSVSSVSSVFRGENETESQTMTLTPIIPTGHWFKLTTSGLASTISITILR